MVATSTPVAHDGPSGPLFDLVMAFIGELRAAGIPISPAQSVTACQALLHASLGDRRSVHSALSTTLITVRSHQSVFDAVFDIFFTAGAATVDDSREPGGGLSGLSDEDLREKVVRAIASGDEAYLGLVAEEVVARHCDIRPGRPAGVGFYAFKALKPLAVDQIVRDLVSAQPDNHHSPITSFIEQEQWETSAQHLQQEVEAVIRRRLVEDRGASAVAGSLRRPLPEDVDFIRASTQQLQEMELALAGLMRRVALALARSRPQQQGDRLDFRKTFRRALSSGGAPLRPRYRPARRPRPEIVVLADISGSVSSFASFTMQLLLAFSGHFSKVRAFAFIDGVAEVTEYFAGADDVSQVMRAFNANPQITWVDGHSDYGNALALFWEQWGHSLSPSSVLLVLGDARNNYHASGGRFLDLLHRRVGALYWLNPEPRERWDTGDSIVTEYAPFCDRVVECRSLNHLETFIESLGA